MGRGELFDKPLSTLEEFRDGRPKLSTRSCRAGAHGRMADLERSLFGNPRHAAGGGCGGLGNRRRRQPA